jgi:hypothetical protein
MAQRVLAENAGVESVRYVLPNKHYIPVDMKYIGVDNTTPYVPETFYFLFGRLFHFWKNVICLVLWSRRRWGATAWFFSSIGCRVANADLLRRESLVN